MRHQIEKIKFEGGCDNLEIQEKPEVILDWEKEEQEIKRIMEEISKDDDIKSVEQEVTVQDQEQIKENNKDSNNELMEALESLYNCASINKEQINHLALLVKYPSERTDKKIAKIFRKMLNKANPYLKGELLKLGQQLVKKGYQV